MTTPNVWLSRACGTAPPVGQTVAEQFRHSNRTPPGMMVSRYAFGAVLGGEVLLVNKKPHVARNVKQRQSSSLNLQISASLSAFALSLPRRLTRLTFHRFNLHILERDQTQYQCRYLSCLLHQHPQWTDCRQDGSAQYRDGGNQSHLIQGRQHQVANFHHSHPADRATATVRDGQANLEAGQSAAW